MSKKRYGEAAFIEKLETENAKLAVDRVNQRRCIKRLEAHIAQLEEALRKYARHKTHCGVYSFYGKPPTAEDCDCGYVRAMRAALSGENRWRK